MEDGDIIHLKIKGGLMPPQNSSNKIVWIIILVFIVLAVGGYFAYTKLFINRGSSGVISKVILNPQCKHNDPNLCKFINGWKEVKYYTMNSVVTSKDGTKSILTFKTAGENRDQMIMVENGTENYNVISIGEATYTKDYSDNKWWKSVTSAEATVKTEEEEKLDFDDTIDNTTYKKIGTEACGKLTCFKYQVIDPAVTESTDYIYFDSKDYQLRKTRSEMNDGSVSESTIDYSKITISEPSPVKDGSPYQGTVPSSSSTTPTTTSNPAVDNSDASAALDEAAAEAEAAAAAAAAASEIPVDVSE